MATIQQLNKIAKANRMYCDSASNRPQMPTSYYCNHQYFPDGVLVFDMESLEVWSFENEESAAQFIKNYSSISDDDFNSYLQTILWSETDEDEDPLDDHYDVDDFDSDGARHQRKECESFIAENRVAIDFLLESGHKIDHILHDFWLNRCGHGVGFWSGDYPEPQASQLDASARKYDQKWVYVGDDGVIYFS